MIRYATRVHVVAAVAVALTLPFLIQDERTDWFWMVFWVMTVLLAALAPFQPAAGLGAYVAAFYGTPRYSVMFQILAESHLLHALVVFAVSGVALFFARGQRIPSLRSPLVAIALAFFGWCLLSSLVSPMLEQGTGRHDPIFLLHAAVLLVSAALTASQAADLTMLALPLATALVCRMGWEGATGLRLEGDIGPLTLIAIPLFAAVAQNARHLGITVAMVLAVAGGFVGVGLTFNRASAVVLIVLVIAAMLRHRRRLWIVAATLVCLAAAIVWFATGSYRIRFEQALAEVEGTSTGSVTERFELWTAGFAMVADHPWIGVGVGNYAWAATTSRVAHRGQVAHNSFVHVAAETGIPGLVLYSALFGLGLVVSGSLALRGQRPIRAIASGLQLSLVAYLVSGLFISRHDMVLAYVLIGWTAGLSALSAARSAESTECA